MLRTGPVGLAILLIAALPGQTRSVHAQADPRAWVAESNRHAQVLLDVLARFAPESAAQYGVTGLDEEVTTLTDDAVLQARAATEAALASLQALRKTTTNAMVRQDLDILIDSARDNLRGADLARDRQKGVRRDSGGDAESGAGS